MEGPPGAALVVIRGDSVIYMEGFGSRQVNRAPGVDTLTVFKAGSIGKTVIALGIFRMVEQGRLRLTARVDSLLPGIAEGTSANWGKELQVQHLLEHSSGLDEMHFNEYYSQSDLEEALLFNPSSKQLRWEPGRTASYSNVGYALLALIGERVSGHSWQDWLDQYVLKPLEMTKSGFGPIPNDIANQAVGHNEGQPISSAPVYHYKPSVSFYTNIVDLSRLLKCLIHRGAPLIQPETMIRLESMRTTPAGRAGLEVGYGAGVQIDYIAGWMCRYHTGKVDGFTAIYEYFPEQNSGFAVLFNGSPEGSIRSAPLVHACRFSCIPRRNSPVPPIFLKNQVSKLDLNEFAGTYAFANPRNAIPGFFDKWMLDVKVVRTGERTFQIDGEDWYWIGSGRLVKAGTIHTGAVFSVDAETGELGLSIGKLYFVKGSLAIWRKVFRWGLWVLSLLGAFQWLLMYFRGKGPALSALWLCFPIISAEVAFYILLKSNPPELGQLNFHTFCILVFTSLVLLTTLAGIWGWIRLLRKDPEKRYQNGGFFFLGFSLVILDLAFCFALWKEGLIGLATFNY